MNEEFKPITTQEQLDAIIKTRLARSEETYAKKYSDYEEVKANNTKLAQDLDALRKSYEELTGNSQKEIEALNVKIKGFEVESLKQRIALEAGLPIETAKRLFGDSEEAIRADADALVKAFNVSHVPPMASTEQATADAKTLAYKELLANLKK